VRLLLRLPHHVKSAWRAGPAEELERVINYGIGVFVCDEVRGRRDECDFHMICVRPVAAKQVICQRRRKRRVCCAKEQPHRWE
jgi:hypothetical protein